MRLLALMCVALLGCSQPSDTKPAKATQHIRLQLVADAVETAAYRSLIAEFEARHPDIEVALRTIGRQRDHVTQLATAFAGGTPPDLFLINYRRYGQFLGKELLEPLGPLAASHGEFKPEDFYTPALEAFQHDGQQLCLPQNISTQVVYYNRSLFQRYGVSEPADDWTWKQFHDTARALTHDLDGDRKPDVFGLDFDPDLIHMAPFVWQAGGRIVDKLDHPTALRLREYSSVIGLMYPKRLRTEVGVMPPLAQRRAVGPEARFIQGGLGMIIQSRRYATALRSIDDLDWDVAPLPRNKQAATLLHSDAYCLTRASAHPQAAALFVDFALSEDGQGLLSASGRIVPARRSVAQSEAFLSPDLRPSRAQVFLDNIEIVRRLPVTPYWYELENRSRPIIEEWMFESMANAGAEAQMGLHDGNRLVMLIQEAVNDLFTDRSS